MNASMPHLPNSRLATKYVTVEGRFRTCRGKPGEKIDSRTIRRRRLGFDLKRIRIGGGERFVGPVTLVPYKVATHSR